MFDGGADTVGWKVGLVEGSCDGFIDGATDGFSVGASVRGANGLIKRLREGYGQAILLTSKIVAGA